MPESDLQWQVHPVVDLPEAFLQTVRSSLTGELQSGQYAAQLLWQRGIRDPDQIPGFLNPDRYQPSSPFEFGQEMHWAVERLQQARDQGERVAIWGDFDADGITATAVLWEGLGQFFPPDQLVYKIPNRLTESHGLSIAGVETLAAQGYRLIVTCDNGSTDLEEIDRANTLGVDMIITDHHTLPVERPPVAAILNPRLLPMAHPLADLSGVAVAYKLVEALYQTLPQVPERPLVALLDLVAIGLIADLVKLKADCRYLAQRGIERLQQQSNGQTVTRPGVARLLELCKRNGDRPTDISFGLGPRINAISRIYGDASFAVELLTSQDHHRCHELAELAELANVRRKALQKDVVQQVTTQLAQIDLATTCVIVLSNPQWSVGILGLVAGQIAQQYDRPTILLSEESRDQDVDPDSKLADSGSWQNQSDQKSGLARGSARSVHQIDLYRLVKNQAHLLHRFGGHPFAAGLSLSIANLPLFTEAINQELRAQQSELGAVAATTIQVDLTVTVAELGRDLFRQLRLLEPCGMGNPVPKLLIQNCWFTNIHHQNIKDWQGRKIRYIKTEFEICDRTGSGFPGIWWEHYKDDIPAGQCDAIAELDFNPYQKRYEIRLIALRLVSQNYTTALTQPIDWILDWRHGSNQPDAAVLQVTQCPSSWDDLQAWFRLALNQQQKLAIAYAPPVIEPSLVVWQRLVGIAKYLSRTQQPVTRTQLLEKLGIGDRTLQIGFQSLKQIGFQVTSGDLGFYMTNLNQNDLAPIEADLLTATRRFSAAVQEEQFHRNYFYHVPLSIIQSAVQL
jgi:single-stranded-DNA-specific exonuclease